jgi:hypothetical protein
MQTMTQHGHYTYKYPSGYQHFLWYRTEEDAHAAAGSEEHEIITSTCDEGCLSFVAPSPVLPPAWAHRDTFAAEVALVVAERIAAAEDPDSMCTIFNVRSTHVSISPWDLGHDVIIRSTNTGAPVELVVRLDPYLLAEATMTEVDGEQRFELKLTGVMKPGGWSTRAITREGPENRA